LASRQQLGGIGRAATVARQASREGHDMRNNRVAMTEIQRDEARAWVVANWPTASEVIRALDRAPIDKHGRVWVCEDSVKADFKSRRKGDEAKRAERIVINVRTARANAINSRGR